VVAARLEREVEPIFSLRLIRLPGADGRRWMRWVRADVGVGNTTGWLISTSGSSWMHCHTAPFADCVIKTVLPGRLGLDTQALSASGADVDGLQFAALDTLHDGLAGHTVGEGGLQHGEPAVGGVVDEQVEDVVGEPDPPGRAGGDLLAGDESVAEPAVQRRWRESELFGGVGHGEQFSFFRVGTGLVAGDFQWWRSDWTLLAVNDNPWAVRRFCRLRMCAITGSG